jgi:DNA polymerase-3 subunit delta
MIRFFGGTDTFDSYTSAKKYAAKIAKDNQLEIEIINADELSGIDQLLEKIEGVGLFSSESVWLLKRPFVSKKFIDELNDNFERVKDHKIIVWHDDAFDKRISLTKKLIKEKLLEEFVQEKSWKIIPWVKTIAKNKGILLSNDQLNLIVERSEGNKWIVYSEIKKLSQVLDEDDGDVLSNELFTSALGLDAKGTIWSFVDYFGEKKFDKLIEECRRLTEYEDNVQYLIAMITRELSIIMRLLILQSKNEDYKQLKLHPYVLQKSLKKSKNFTLKEVRKLIDGLQYLDFIMKKGDISGRLGLKLFLYGIKGDYYFS